MNLEQYQQAMDPELRAAMVQMLPMFSSMPSDPVAARKAMAEVFAAVQAQVPKNEQVTVENRSVPGPPVVRAVDVGSPLGATTEDSRRDRPLAWERRQ